MFSWPFGPLPALSDFARRSKLRELPPSLKLRRRRRRTRRRDTSSGKPALILRAFAARTHFDQARVEAAEHFDQIGLCSHDLGDIFVNSGHFVESRGQQYDVARSNLLLHRAPAK